MADIFLSYSRAVREPTLDLANQLWGEGYSTWMDVRLKTGGPPFEQVIDAEVDAAQAVITIWSPPAIKSSWIKYESARAKRQGKLFCVHTEDFDPSLLPGDFHGLHSEPIGEFPRLFNALIEKGVTPESRDDLPLENQLEMEGLREWRNNLEFSQDIAELEAFAASYERAPMLYQIITRRLNVLKARLTGDVQMQAIFDMAIQQNQTDGFKFFLRAPNTPAEMSDEISARFIELDPEEFIDFTEEDPKRTEEFAHPRRAAEAEIRKRNTPPEEGILRINTDMHTAAIRRISVTADGKRMATASHDKTVKLWSLETGKLIRNFRPPIGEGDEGKVFAVAIDPEGKWLSAGGWLGEWGTTQTHIFIFDTETGAITARLGPLPEVVLDLDVSPDGARLAAGLGDKGLRIWSMPDGEMLAEDEDYGGDIYGLAFSPDGQRLAATSYDGDIRLYDLHGRLLERETAPDGVQPFGIAFSPDGTRLAVGYTDRLEVSLLDAKSLHALGKADTSGLSGGDLSKISFLADGRLAAGGQHADGDFPVFVWEDGGSGTRSRWPGPDNTVMDLSGLPGSAGGGLALAGGEPSWSVLNKDGEKRVAHGPPFADLRGKREGHFLVSADGKKAWLGLEYRDKSPVVFDLAALDVTPLKAAPDGFIAPEISRLYIEGWRNETAPTLSVKSGLFGKTRDKKLALRSYEPSRSLAIAPEGNGFVLGAEWWLRRFDDQGDSVWEKAVPSTCWGVNLACGGRLILAAYGDGTIRWHRYEDGEELLALFIHVEAGEARDWVVWMPDGHYDASPGGHDLIGWHVNRGDDREADFYPVETFQKAFHNPAKVRAALDGI